jgi:hypothetical protein
MGKSTSFCASQKTICEKTIVFWTFTIWSTSFCKSHLKLGSVDWVSECNNFVIYDFWFPRRDPNIRRNATEWRVRNYRMGSIHNHNAKYSHEDVQSSQGSYVASNGKMFSEFPTYRLRNSNNGEKLRGTLPSIWNRSSWMIYWSRKLPDVFLFIFVVINRLYFIIGSWRIFLTRRHGYLAVSVGLEQSQWCQW